MSKLGDVLSKLVEIKLITVEGLGAEPLAAKGWDVWGLKLPSRWAVFGKNNYFNIIKSHFASV